MPCRHFEDIKVYYLARMREGGERQWAEQQRKDEVRRQGEGRRAER